VAIYIAAARYDRARTTIYVAYALDEHVAERFSLLQSATKGLASCKRVWHLPSEGRDAEVSARGRARYVLRKYQIRPDLRTPPRMRANLRVPTLYSEKRKYFFFPDRVLVYDGRGVHAIPYATLELRGGERRCIEDEDLPLDARVVETVWLHALADGSPDPRFPTNRRCPVALYGELELSGPANLRELFQCSRVDGAREFLGAVETIAGSSDWSDGDEAAEDWRNDSPADDDASRDELYEEVLRFVVGDARADASRVATIFGIDPSRADAILTVMERDGFLGVGEDGLRAVNWSATRYVAAAYGEEDAGARERAKGTTGSRRHAKRGSNDTRRRAPHEVLGVSAASTEAEIAAAYRRLARIYHPDKVANLAPEFEELAERRMKEINAAYRALRSRR
jgi:DnaJ-domain-containing protein 1